jgi:hypothetical protein
MVGPEEAERLLTAWESNPDHWWLREDAPLDTALSSASMLAEVQRYGNMLRAMTWRIGRVPNGCRLYTTDTPLAGYLTPIRPWWETGAFMSFEYYIALSPTTLMTIRRPPSDDNSVEPRASGPRLYQDYRVEEGVFAQLVISRDAHRYMYGNGAKVSPEAAAFVIHLKDQAELQDAIENQGFDPNPPNIVSKMRQTDDT